MGVGGCFLKNNAPEGFISSDDDHVAAVRAEYYQAGSFNPMASGVTTTTMTVRILILWHKKITVVCHSPVLGELCSLGDDCLSIDYLKTGGAIVFPSDAEFIPAFFEGHTDLHGIDTRNSPA